VIVSGRTMLPLCGHDRWWPVHGPTPLGQLAQQGSGWHSVVTGGSSRASMTRLSGRLMITSWSVSWLEDDHGGSWPEQW